MDTETGAAEAERCLDTRLVGLRPVADKVAHVRADTLGKQSGAIGEGDGRRRATANLAAGIVPPGVHLRRLLGTPWRRRAAQCIARLPATL